MSANNAVLARLLADAQWIIGAKFYYSKGANQSASEVRFPTILITGLTNDQGEEFAADLNEAIAQVLSRYEGEIRRRVRKELDLT